MDIFAIQRSHWVETKALERFNEQFMKEDIEQRCDKQCVLVIRK